MNKENKSKDKCKDKSKDKSKGKSKNGIFRKLLIIVGGLISILVIAFFIYVNNYYKASEVALNTLNASSNIQVLNNELTFDKDKKNDIGIIFYPGGKVDEKAYAPLIIELANKGYFTKIVKMPFRLAVFNSNGANNVINNNPNIKKWYIMGHSLGGAMAGSYTFENQNKIKGIIFLASYTTKDLSKSGIKALSIYGSEDGVLNKESYKKYQGNFPKDLETKIIDGGNHGGFGSYGMQKGDNESKLQDGKQIEETARIVDEFIKKNN